MLLQTHTIPLSSTGMLSPLMKDYLYNSEKVEQLYALPPVAASVPAAIERKKQQPVNRELLVDVLLKQSKDFELTEQTRNNIALLKDSNTFTITAAHQPSLLLHPAYYAHKIASVISLANELKHSYPAYNFVPVFWIGSEDHDFDELGKAKIYGKEIVWQTSHSGPLGRYPLDGISEAIQQFAEITGNQELTALLQTALQNTNSFGTFTHYLLNALFGKYGLVIINQDDAALKAAFADVIQKEVTQSFAIDTIAPAINFLETNYKAQAKPREINFFYLGDNYRERIVKENGVYTVLNQNISFTETQMSEEIQQHPERFSPNVIYRPLYQEYVLPNIAFVGGGAECSYWLQLKPLFELFNVAYPLVLHRPPLAEINASTKKKIEKLSIPLTDIFQPIDAFVNQYIEANTNADLSLEAGKKALQQVFDSILVKATQTDVTLQSSVLAEQQKVLNGLEQLEGKILKAHKRKNETLVTQLRAVHEAIFPNGTFQERSESFLPHLTNPDFMDTLVQVASPFDWRVVFVEV